MKILTVIGARPMFIKEAPLHKELIKLHEETIVHTGQHYDASMSDVFFKELGIPKPKYNLMAGNSKASSSAQIASIIARLEPIIKKEAPDLVLVPGDTNSTLAGAICASKCAVKVAHVEAGMRSFDRTMPEEINRIVADHISDVLFCSTKNAVENLKKESIEKNVFLCGDLMIDSLRQNAAIAAEKSSILKKLGLKKSGYILATIHRASNTDSRQNLAAILEALAESDQEIILPLHPRTKKFIQKYGIFGKIKSHKLRIIDPVGYFDMLALEKNAAKIATDSGGIQKEAYFFKVPCITLRDSTEWTETVDDGWNILAGTDKSKIKRALESFVPGKKQNETYGNGHAAGKISKILSELHN